MSHCHSFNINKNHKTSEKSAQLTNRRMCPWDCDSWKPLGVEDWSLFVVPPSGGFFRLSDKMSGDGWTRLKTQRSSTIDTITAVESILLYCVDGTQISLHLVNRKLQLNSWQLPKNPSLPINWQKPGFGKSVNWIIF